MCGVFFRGFHYPAKSKPGRPKKPESYREYSAEIFADETAKGGHNKILSDNESVLSRSAMFDVPLGMPPVGLGRQDRLVTATASLPGNFYPNTLLV